MNSGASPCNYGKREWHCAFAYGILSFAKTDYGSLKEISHYLRVWLTHFRSQPSIAKRKCKNKSRLCPLPTNDLNVHCVRYHAQPTPYIRQFSSIHGMILD